MIGRATLLAIGLRDLLGGLARGRHNTTGSDLKNSTTRRHYTFSQRATPHEIRLCDTGGTR